MSTKPLSPRVETRIKIQTLLGEGQGVREISRKLGVSSNTVLLWKNRSSPTDKKRPARKRTVSPTTCNMIKTRMYRKLGSSTRKCAAVLNQSKRFRRLNKKISYVTIHRHLKSTNWGRRAFKSLKKPLLSQKNIQDRLKFGEYVEKSGYLTDGKRGEELRRNILFTDESWIYLNPHPNVQITRYRTEKRTDVPPSLSPKKPLKVMVAAGFCARGVTELHVVPCGQNITAKYYRDQILPIYFNAVENKDLFPNIKKVTLMQDNAPAHTSKETMKLLNEQSFTLWGKNVWPGNSPDLNPIENLWAYLKKNIYPKNVKT